MKHLQTFACALVIAFWVLLPVPFLFTACTTPTAQRQAFNTVYSVAKTVDTAYRSYLDLVIAGQLKTNSVPKVAQQYDALQGALRAATVLVTMNTNAPAPPGLVLQAAKFTSDIELLKKEDK